VVSLGRLQLVPVAKELLDLLLDTVHLTGIADLQDDLVDRAHPEQSDLAGLKRNQHHVILVAPNLLPFGASTPMTVNGTFRIRTSWPIGDCPVGNRFVATVLPRTATHIGELWRVQLTDVHPADSRPRLLGPGSPGCA
jgi:hypothetical protein